MRYPALEGLRGLAALVVVIHHHLLVLPTLFPYAENATGLAAVFLYSPVHLVWAGGEAVLLFFVLSGFVLSLSTWEGHPLKMPEFIIKRIWRIWIPCLIAVTLAFGAAKLVGPQAISGTSPWFNAIWQQANMTAYIDHLLMLGNMDRANQAFIPVVWSLKWEMWGSLLLPLILLVACQRSAIVIAGSAGVLAYYWWAGGGSAVPEGLLRFLPMFVLGATLAYHRTEVTAWIQRQTQSVQRLLLMLAVVIIPFQWYGFSNAPSFARSAINDYAALTGAALLIVLALGCNGVNRWLERPIVLWLGRISFSVYLYHALVLTVVVRLGHQFLPLPVLMLLSFGLTFIVAHIAYDRIERPAMRYGQQIMRRYSEHSLPSSKAQKIL
ncbi:acyltransferase family protein [Deinococcus oregonensis]|uniref:Acyltransferase family protein n=1 Tax=Deinococcus oregonensis TaxID=1805970 RepID=A0ABV6B3X3_9DEIO